MAYLLGGGIAMADRSVAEGAESLRNDLEALDRRVGDLVGSLETVDRDLHRGGEAALREMLDLLSDARFDLHAARGHIETVIRYAANFDL